MFAKLCLLLATLVGVALSGTVPINDGKYILETTVSLGGVLSVKATVETTGWVGFGLSPNGSMIFSDLIIGGFSSSVGAYIGDRYASAPGPPGLDSVQNVMLVSASENMTHTVLEFTRMVDTGDASEDIPVQNMMQNIVWAYGATDEITYHDANRGTLELNLMEG